MLFLGAPSAVTFVPMQRSKAGYIVELLIHTVFWLGAYYALKALAASTFQMLVENNGKVVSQDMRMLFPYALVVLGFLILLFYSNIFWLLKKIVPYLSSFKRVVIIGSWLLVLYALNYLVVWSLIGSPASTPHQPALLTTGPPPMPFLETFSLRNWWQMQPVIALIFVLVAGLAAAYFYIGDSIKSKLLRSEAEANRASTELSFLRSQVNPHFLFNTLNNLFSMAQREGKENVADKIEKLSGMMRYMLYDSNTALVSLEKEINYLRDCIALNQMRYAGDQVEVSFRLPGEEAIQNIQLAPMLLMCFLENAFKHGVRMGLHSYINMEISIDQNKLIFTCRNIDYHTIKRSDAEPGGIGLENVKRRLELIYPGRHTLIAGSDNGHYSVNLKIDLS